jgi:hypothetical protein
VQLLLNDGRIDLNARNNYGRTALSFAKKECEVLIRNDDRCNPLLRNLLERPCYVPPMVVAEIDKIKSKKVIKREIMRPAGGLRVL